MAVKLLSNFFTSWHPSSPVHLEPEFHGYFPVVFLCGRGGEVARMLPKAHVIKLKMI